MIETIIALIAALAMGYAIGCLTTEIEVRKKEDDLYEIIEKQWKCITILKKRLEEKE